jgi:hypothetical protein
MTIVSTCVVLGGVCYVLFLVWFALRVRSLKQVLHAARARNAHGRYIYAFTDYGQVLPVVKIGRATNPETRLAAHRTAAPFGLLVFMVRRVPDAHHAERVLHTRYARWRVRSNGEWFYLHPLMLLELLSLDTSG